MRTVILSLIAIFALAACGVDGAPTPPAAKTTGVSISGEAAIGVTGKF